MTNKRGLVAARKQKPWKVAALSSKSFTNPWLSCYKYSDDRNTRISKILPMLVEISKRASLCCWFHPFTLLLPSMDWETCAGKDLWPGIQLLHSYMLSSLFHLSFISRDLSLVTSWFAWSLINNPCKEWRSPANFHVQYEGKKMTIQSDDRWKQQPGCTNSLSPPIESQASLSTKSRRTLQQQCSQERHIATCRCGSDPL